MFGGGAALFGAGFFGGGVGFFETFADLSRVPSHGEDIIIETCRGGSFEGVHFVEEGII